LDLRGRKCQEAGEDCIMRSFIACTLHQTFLGENKMSRTCSTDRKMKNAYNIFVGRPEGKRPHRRPRCIWEDNRMDRMEIVCQVVDWTHLAHGRD
jgi:hypothetical protein